MDKNAPKYIALYNTIKKDILTDVYPASTFLPPEGELIEKYKASRTTIRRAIMMLKEEHLVDVHQGRGTMVLENKKTNAPYNFLSVKSSSSVTSRFTIGSDYQTSSQGAVIDVIPAELKVASALKIEPGTGVYRLQRVKVVNEMFFSYVTSYITQDIAPNLEQYNGQIYYLYKFLNEHYGISFENGQDIISAGVAGFVESRLLNVNTGAPLLIFKRTTYSNGLPFEYSESINRADLLEIVIDSQAFAPNIYF